VYQLKQFLLLFPMNLLPVLSFVLLYYGLPASEHECGKDSIIPLCLISADAIEVIEKI
jgi:hypothetical protein